MTACMAEFFAFVRDDHHLIRRNDRNPTPSHPMNIRKIFLEQVRIIILSKNMIRSRKNCFGVGSLCI